MQNVIELFVGLLTPEKCLACDEGGSLLCRGCRGELYFPDRCFLCKKPSVGGLTCHACIRRNVPIIMQIVASAHEGLARDLVYEAKYGMTRESADIMGLVLASKLPYLARDCVVVPIPSTQAHRRMRGYDTASRMAMSIAMAHRLPYVDCLRRATKAHQVGLAREERIKNVRGTFSISNSKKIHNKNIILVDDVVTTGATMESASRALVASGAGGVIATYFVRAE